jgi:hypothetical protein
VTRDSTNTNDMAAKFSITVPDAIGEDLQRWADEEGRPRANLAAFLIELAVRQKYPDKYPPERVKAVSK